MLGSIIHPLGCYRNPAGGLAMRAVLRMHRPLRKGHDVAELHNELAFGSGSRPRACYPRRPPTVMCCARTAQSRMMSTRSGKTAQPENQTIWSTMEEAAPAIMSHANH